MARPSALSTCLYRSSWVGLILRGGVNISTPTSACLSANRLNCSRLSSKRAMNSSSLGIERSLVQLQKTPGRNRSGQGWQGKNQKKEPRAVPAISNHAKGTSILSAFVSRSIFAVRVCLGLDFAAVSTSPFSSGSGIPT